MANIMLKDANGNDVVYKNITSIKLNTEDGSVVEFVEQPMNYVVGNYTEKTLLLENWNGTSYYLDIPEFVNLYDVQIGIPPNSSAPNARMLIESCLSVPEVTSNDSGTSLKISALKAPTTDVIIAVWWGI